MRDLENLPETRWCVARYADLIADPNAEIERLCAAIGFEWDRRIDGGLPVASHTVSTPRPDKWRARAPEVETALALVGEVAGRAARAARR